MRPLDRAAVAAHKLLRWNSYSGRRACAAEMAEAGLQATAARHLDGLLAFVADNAYYGPLLNGRERGQPPNGRDISVLPVLTKDIIRRRRDDLLTKPMAKNGVVGTSSGGSTGAPITIMQDAEYRAWSEATKDYYFLHFLDVERWAARSVWLWGSERDLLGGSRRDGLRVATSHFLQRMLFLNTFAVSDAQWLEYIDGIARYRPHYVAGYAGSLYQIATVARRHNIPLYRPAFVYSSAERLQDFMRARIEEQFGTRVYDFYGSREVGAMAGECSAGRKHIFAANNRVEVLDNKGSSVAAGEEGRLIVTNLHNHAMPLLRYEIGDTGSLATDPCPCGSELPALQSLTGRVTDHFRLADGTLIHGEYFTHLFYFREWVAHFQVDQLASNQVRISVVLAGARNEPDMREITAGIRVVMGQECDVEWCFVDAISKTKHGKHLFTRRLFD